MSRSIFPLFMLTLAAVGCGGGTATPGGKTMMGTAGKMMPGGPGMGGTGGMTAPMGGGGTRGTMGGGMKPGMTGAAGAIVIGIPTPGTPGTVFPGGGPN